MKKKIIAEDKQHLRKIIEKEIEKNGYQCDLNHIDVSKVDDMSFLFCNSKFNGDISEWDVSKVIDMDSMFQSSEFDGNISKWNVSNLVEMSFMFEKSKFSHDLSDWKPYKVTELTNTFNKAKCIQPYWSYDYEGMEDRINNYWMKKELNKELDSELNENNRKSKKIKL